MMVPGVSPSWSEGYKPEYVPYVAKGVRGPHVITSKEETACRQQPGLRHDCQVHAVSSAGGGGSSQKIFVLCQHTHNPPSSFLTLDLMVVTAKICFIPSQCLYAALNYVIDTWECGHLDSCHIASYLCNNMDVNVDAYVIMLT